MLGDGKMPIVDYERRAKTTLIALDNNTEINSTNKKHLKDYLKAKDVKAGRVEPFIRFASYFLKGKPDIKTFMEDREKVNNYFAELKDWMANHKFKRKGKIQKGMSLSCYGGAKNAVIALATWLNDGDKPKGFKDQKNDKKSRQRRDLSPEDMISWEDGLKMINKTQSVQFKAIITTLLDGGFRPSEFNDLDYGDVSIKKVMAVIHIKDGKTGPRDSIVFRCVPYLQRWLNQHPSKKKSEPLWVMEFPACSNDKKHNKGEVVRYKYPALARS